MQMAISKKMMWLAIAMLLSACSIVSNKAPDELVRQGIQRNLLRNNQFNFNGQIRLSTDQDKVETSSNQVADETLDDETEVATSAFSSEPVRKKHEVEMRDKANAESHYADNTLSEDCDKCEELLNKNLSLIVDQVSIPFSGAVDVPHGKFELIPEVRYEASNILFSIKMPMQVDFQKKVLITDIRAIRPFVNAIGSILIGKPVETFEEPYVVKTFPEWTNRLPLKELIHAIPKAIDDGYASYDKKAFVYLSLDEAGKKLGARYRVRLNSTREQDQIAAVAVFDSLYELLKQSEKRDAGLSGQADKSENEDYAALQELLDEQSGKLDKVKYDYSITDFYFDDHGRILAMHGINGFIMDDLKIRRLLGNKKMNNSFWIYFDYRSHPKFTLESSRKNVLFQK
ncbi:hypothetical protein BGI36_07105 [Snodgrassella communis]|jgi:hypothetical protein|uniref:hypothetical protein n=1 Tax=Snodgrassella communis TaxID=2946699 RepID=UPI000C1F8D8C|nr:hypothetical protein [Snodgrassella communis]PIT21049.1 hypothetical protein BGI36_07105 [Snodgrassella communis]